jgi:endonuclease/exonuclease/phosphatase family metal-dependent hydrolase
MCRVGIALALAHGCGVQRQPDF